MLKLQKKFDKFCKVSRTGWTAILIGQWLGNFIPAGK